MQDYIEDAAILTGLGLSSSLLFTLLWVFLGPMGIAGAIAGYGVGLSFFLVPLSEE